VSGTTDAIIGIQLTTGKFITGLASNTTVISKFIIKKPDGSNYNLGTGPAYKLSADRKVFTITTVTGADPMPTGGLTVTIPKEAIDPSQVVPGGGATGGTVTQANIPVKTSTTQATGGDNAIVVTLTEGSFVPGITGADFIHSTVAPISVIVTNNESEVELSADGKTATIYGIAAATASGDVKIGINASALLGYPVITDAKVVVSSKTVDQRDITKSVTNTPGIGDNYIKIELAAGKEFDTGVGISDFNLIHPATAPNGITIETGDLVTLSSDKTKVVIKVTNGSTSATSFQLKIFKTAFGSTTKVLPGDITVTTTKQAAVVKESGYATSGNEIKLTIALTNGGKFKTEADGLLITQFTRTAGASNADIGTSLTNLYRSSATEVVITLGTPFDSVATITVSIDPAAFDPSWPVVADDVTITPGS
jgi:hypothetical protein